MSARAAGTPSWLMPPAPVGLGKAWLVALLAHALLLAGLAAMTSWHRQKDLPLSTSAELWTTLPSISPQAITPEPTPETAPKAMPEPVPKPLPKPAPAAEPKPEPKPAPKADIRTEAEKPKPKKETPKPEPKQAEPDKRKAKEDDKRKTQEEEKRIERMRAENLKRLQSLAQAAEGPSHKVGSEAARGPSNAYAGRVRARIKPNIVFTDELTSNPVAEVQVRLSPSGAIISRRLIKSSGQPKWDQAVLAAIDKTAALPRDENGQVPAELILSFRPKD